MTGKQLYILASEEAPSHWHWLAQDESGMTRQGTGTRANEFAQVILAIPGQDIRILSHDLPRLRKSEQAKALAYAVEDQICDKLDNQFLAMACEDEKRVAIISRNRMAHWLEQAALTGLDPDCIVADFELLPDGQVLALQDRVIQGGRHGDTLDPDWSDLTENAPEAISTAQALMILAESGSKDCINLRQGEFAKQEPHQIPMGLWAGFAASIVMLGCFWLAYQMVETRAMQQRSIELAAQASRLYTQATGQPAPSNPALAAMRIQQQNTGNSSGFFHLTQALVSALQSVPGAELQDMAYLAAKDTLTLQLAFDGFADAQALDDALQAQNVRYTPGGVRETSDGSLLGEGVLQTGANP